MPQANELTVEAKELLARATELEKPITGMPTDVTKAPCALAAAEKASKQINFNGQNIQAYLAEGQREREHLAQSLRSAAKAYGAVDEQSARNVSGNGSGGAEQVSNEGGGSAPLTDTQVATLLGEPEFLDLKDAANKIAAPDQSASLRPFADGWTSYNKTLQGSLERFRPFQSWTGAAATAVQKSLEQQRQWLSHMAELCGTLSKQAMYLYDLQNWAATQHPKLPEIEQLDNLYKTYKDNPDAQKKILDTYKLMQQKSEEIVTQHRQRADIPVINPPKPPQAVEIDNPKPTDLIPEWMKQASGATGQLPQGTPMTSGVPSSSLSSANMPDTAALTSAMNAGMPNLGGGPSMSPASVAGGGVGGLGLSAASLPVAPASAEAPGIPAVPAGAGGPNGGGMGGGMPMMGGMGHGAGAGGSKGGGKGLGDEKALYTADRTWTEGVIGNRPRQGAGVAVKG